MRVVLLVAGLALVAAMPLAAQEEERGFFGVGIAEVGKVLIITDVYAATAASRAGVEPGDVILSIDGIPPGSSEGMMAKVGSLKPQTPVTFRLLRGTLELDCKVALGARPGVTQPSGRKLDPNMTARIESLRALGASEGDVFGKVYGLAVGSLQGELHEEAQALCALARAVARAEIALADPTADLPTRARWMHRVDQASWLLRLAEIGRPAPMNHGRPEIDDAAVQSRIAELLGQLGDGRYEVRNAAHRELIRMGAPVIGALADFMTSSDLEVAWRARWIKRSIEDALAVPVQEWHPVVLEVVGPADGAPATDWTVRVALGAAPVAGARYRARALSGDAPRGEVTFEALGPDRVRQAAGAPLVAGVRLVYLAPPPRAAAAR